MTITTEGTTTVIDAGSGNDTVDVSQRTDGGFEVTTNGETVSLTAAQSQDVTIRGGSGNDTVTVGTNVTTGLTIEGGTGNDTLIGGAGKDTIDGGAGRDYVEGRGNDDTLRGGDGVDTLYGLDGNDTISGGKGQDYIDGGRGNDVLSGNDGDDAISGGLGDDTLNGGKGNDSLIAGAGTDRINDTHIDKDNIFAEAGDTINADEFSTKAAREVDMATTNAAGTALGSSVTINGDAQFQTRVQSDLETLRSLPDGQALLASLDDSGHATTINATTGGNSASGGSSDVWQNADGTPGKGDTATVNYNTTRTNIGSAAWNTRPPIVGFHHELLHGQDYVNGTLTPGQTNGTNNRELSATGLAFDQDGDGTADPNNRSLTENSFRDDLNLTPRLKY